MIAGITAILAFFVEPVWAGLIVLLSGCFALLAAWWRGRPSLLLAGFSLFVFSFICLPQALPSLLDKQGLPPLNLGLPLHLLFPLGAVLSVACLFILSCRRQSGGVRLSALEVSEDLERVVCLFSRLTSLLVIPLVLLPPACLVLGKIGGFAPGTVSQQPLLHWLNPEQEALQGASQSVGWFVALLVLGNVAAAYMRDVHHRYPAFRLRMGDRIKAWIECAGSLLLLLPMSWAMIEWGWQMTLADLASPDSGSLEPGMALVFWGAVPQWGLYGLFPLAFLLLASSAVAMILRSLVFLFGPIYLKKRASSHVDSRPISLGEGAETL